MSRYPKIKDTTYPGIDNIDVYAYQNTFNYDRWQPNTQLLLTTVKWDGTRDVVKFDTDTDRDAYFSGLTGEKITLESAFALIEPDNIVRLPVPYDVAQRYNYIVATYPIMTSATDRIDYETGAGINKYFYFIRRIEPVAPSATSFYLELDYFTTYINSVDITYCMLARGHAPLAAVTPDEFLSDPIAHNAYLMEPDVQPRGGDKQITAIDDLTLNAGFMFAVIATTANVGAGVTWDNVTPAAHMYTQQVAISTYMIGMEPDNLGTFLDNAPKQFLQTVQGVFFVNKLLLYKVNPRDLFGVRIWDVGGTGAEFGLEPLTVADFNLPENYKRITKLYTSPYSELELVREDGTTTRIRIEDTNNKLKLLAKANTLFPALAINGFLSGIGGNVNNTIVFKLLSQSNFLASGDWYDNLMSWDIPVFSVYQNNAEFYEFNNDDLIAQQRLAAQNARQSAQDGNNAAWQVGKNSADNAQAIGIATVDYNTQIVDKNQTNLVFKTLASTNLATSMTGYDNAYTQAMTEADNQYQQATSIVNAIGGVVGAVAGLNLQGLASSTIGAVQNGVNTILSISMNNTKTDLAVSNNNNKTRESNSNLNDVSGFDRGTMGGLRDINNTMQADFTGKNYGTAISNINTTLDMSEIIAGRSLETALAGINANIAQAATGAVHIMGANTPTTITGTRPQMLVRHVVTVGVGDIKKCGDEMLRYGYTLNQNWRITDLCPMLNYSYWRTSEIWITPGAGVTQDAIDTLAGLFNNGITVWSNPDNVRQVSIYDNWR